MTPLVLLPGMMCDARLFAPQCAAINDRSVMVSPIIGFDMMCELARQVLVHAPPKFILGGLSMGGIVAMEVLRQAPERIAGLILMDTNPLPETDVIKAKRGPQIQAVRAGKLDQVMSEQMIPNYLHRDYPNAAIDALCLTMASSLGGDVFVRQSLALGNRADQRETLRAYKGNSLIMHGDDDRLCPADRHELMRDLMPHAQYNVIKQAGHLPTLERPEVLNGVILGWLMQFD